MVLPVDIDTVYADDGADASVKLHQQHHDTIHAAVNARARVVDSSAGDVQVISTTGETDLIALTLPADPVVGDLWVADFAGAAVNTSGSNQNLTVKFYLGTTAYLTSPVSVVASNASPRRWFAHVSMYITDSTHQEIFGQFFLGAAGTAGTWDTVGTANMNLTSWAQGLENTSTSKAVKLTATLGSAAGTQSMTASVGALSVIRV